MKGLVCLVFLLLAQAAFAQTVEVKSGDHPGFTRLVLDLPQVTDWALGRTDEGYELRLDSAGVRFDLTNVFDDIKRNRLAAIWMDPASGTLRLGVACACHAIPFEFRPGIIVVDLRDGPPPKGSSFELALDGTAAADLSVRGSLRPKSRPRTAVNSVAPATGTDFGYDWIEAGKPEPSEGSVAAVAPPDFSAVTEHETGPLKAALLRQLGDGAAQGIVQMAQPRLSAPMSGDTPPIGPRARFSLGEAPGFNVATKRTPENLMIADGENCIADDRLDVAKWVNDLPVSIQLAEARTNLLGEFDKPNPDKVIAAVKLLISIGFGAEARQLLAHMPVEGPDATLWASMATLVDGGSQDGVPETGGPFAAMATCDTAAALWAVLALPEISLANPPRTEAVLRAFSALPLPLRSALGPDLAAKFLAAGDLAAARAIKNALLRGVHAETPELAVMQATIALAAGNPTAASEQLEPVLVNAGPAIAETLIALVDANIAAGNAVDPQTALALAALVHEQTGTELDPALRRAQILALGSSGDFDQAFDLLPQMPDAETDLWQLLAQSESGAAVLAHAVLAPDVVLPKLGDTHRTEIANKLTAAGLPGAALKWIGSTENDSSEEPRLLAAKANLMMGEAEAALANVAALEGATASEVRAQALVALGKPAAAAKAWASAGNVDAELRAQSWASNWAELAQSDASFWQSAATLAKTDSTIALSDLPGPLSRGTALVEESANARQTLVDLLARVPSP